MFGNKFEFAPAPPGDRAASSVPWSDRALRRKIHFRGRCRESTPRRRSPRRPRRRPRSASAERSHALPPAPRPFAAEKAALRAQHFLLVFHAEFPIPGGVCDTLPSVQHILRLTTTVAQFTIIPPRDRPACRASGPLAAHPASRCARAKTMTNHMNTRPSDCLSPSRLPLFITPLGGSSCAGGLGPGEWRPPRVAACGCSRLVRTHTAQLPRCTKKAASHLSESSTAPRASARSRAPRSGRPAARRARCRGQNGGRRCATRRPRPARRQKK